MPFSIEKMIDKSDMISIEGHLAVSIKMTKVRTLRLSNSTRNSRNLFEGYIFLNIISLPDCFDCK